ncbi:type VI secretion system ATPase TssH, partial [Enterobacter sp. CGMCC 5087]
DDEPMAALRELEQELDTLQASSVRVSAHVDARQVASVVAEWTGVPVNRISQSELDVVMNLPAYLCDSIRGQSLAIEHLHRHLLTARADLRRTGRPLGAFLLVGPSGVGKTETVVQI